MAMAYVPLVTRHIGYGIFNLVSVVAMLDASIIAGLLWDSYGPATTYLVGAVITALAFLGLTGFFQRQ